MSPPTSPQPDLALLASVVGCLKESVCVTDADFRDGPHILYVNSAFTKLTGYPAEEIVGKTPRVLYGPRSDHATLQSLRGDLVAGGEASGEVISYRRDGSEFLMSFYAMPVRDRDMRTAYYFGVHRDATAERRREAMSQVFLAAFEHATDAIFIFDATGKVLHANPACSEMAGSPIDSIVGRSVRDAGLAPRRLRIYRDIIASLANGSDWYGELETSGRISEPRLVTAAITRVPTSDPEPCFLVDARDVTDQRRLEYIADAANLAENMGYVFAGLRHELGNPINSIKTALTVVRQSLSTLPMERVSDYLDRVLQEVGRVEYLLRSMASFNSTHQPVLEPVPVAPFLTRLASIVRADAERRNVRISVHVDDAVVSVIADPRALHQVLLNLLTNALDALVDRQDARIRLSAKRRGAHVHITVADNGPGIPRQLRSHLFKPFHTTKAKGTGLGLVISRKLVTLMRGTIELEPPSGGETMFTVSLDADPPENTLTRSGITTRPPPRMAP